MHLFCHIEDSVEIAGIEESVESWEDNGQYV